MNSTILDIDGFIGSWGYSKALVKNFLAENADKPVTIRISSLGGEVDHALSIHNQLAEHGQVTVILSAFNASSATLLTLGASLVKMQSNSFYLIHKALQWVDTWGNMNEDDIDQLIVSLEKEKNELQKVTLVLAKMYGKKSGKPTFEILDLMKQETWLTAEEALAWGFVDEIIESPLADSPLKNEKLVRMLNYADLPSLTERETPPPTETPSTTTKKPSTIVGNLTSIIKTTVKHILHMRNLSALNTTLGVPSLETSEEGTYLNDEQLGILNDQLEASTQTATERDQAVSDRSEVLSSLNAMDPSIAQAETIEGKIQAIRTMLASKPSTNPAGIQTKNDKVISPDGVDWDTLMALPHMQEESN